MKVKIPSFRLPWYTRPRKVQALVAVLVSPGIPTIQVVGTVRIEKWNTEQFVNLTEVKKAVEESKSIAYNPERDDLTVLSWKEVKPRWTNVLKAKKVNA